MFEHLEKRIFGEAEISNAFRISKGGSITTPKTLNELRIMMSAIPFRDACVTCNKASGRKWRIAKIVFTDFQGGVLLGSGKGFALMTQRGKEKLYATLDPIVNDINGVIGIAGYVMIKASNHNQMRAAGLRACMADDGAKQESYT